MVVLSIETSGCQPQTIVIGRRGTYETTQIAFDLSYLVEAYGSGVAVLAVKRSQDESAYPAVVTQENNTLTWTVSETDTAYVGAGECQLMWYVEGGLAKTIIYPMVVMRDILQTAEEPPDGYENWIEHLTGLGAKTQQNAQNASQSATEAKASEESAAESAQRAEDAAGMLVDVSATATTLEPGQPATAEYDEGVFKFGIPKGDKLTYTDLTEADKEDLVQGPIKAAQDAAVDAVGTAKTNAVDAVNGAGTTQVQNVNSAGSTQVNTVNQAGATQVGNVNQAGATQVQAIEDKGDEVIDSIPSDYSDLTAEVDDLTRQLSDVESVIDDTVQLITEKTYTYSPTYVRKNTDDYGEITTGSWQRATSEELIGFNTAYSVKISKKAGYSIYVYFFNSSKVYTNRISITGTGAEEYVIPVGIGYFRIKISKNDTSAEISIAEAEENVSIDYTFLYDSLTDSMQAIKIENLEKFDGLFDVETNLINPSEMTGGYINILGTVIENSSYKTTDFIPVKANQSICFTTRLRKFLAFDALKRPIASTFENNDVSAGYVFTATVNGFVRASVYVSDANYMAVYGNQVKEYTPYGEIIINNLKLTDDNGLNKGNILYGKKWAVCGDSFTAGDFTGASDYTFPDGRFAGQNKVYSRYIALRNDMTLQFLAGGGRTLAYPSDGTFGNSFTNPSANFNYLNIAEDVDYITLYFGINDSHHEAGSSGSDGEDTTGEIPIGTIDDTTTATFYGAWNVVLEWIATNRPFAHVGIIVSNGCDRDAFRIATIECAKKWGFPYIDLNGDEKTPMMLRSTNPDISSKVKAIRTNAQRVSSTNAHPNVSAHLYESTFIEDFLRSI